MDEVIEYHGRPAARGLGFTSKGSRSFAGNVDITGSFSNLQGNKHCKSSKLSDIYGETRKIGCETV